MAVIENDVLMKFKDSSGNINLLYPITRAEDVDGLQEAIRNQGVVTEGTGAVYTATVEGITSLSAGASFVMIPHTVSTSSSPKLNVNGLGEKFIRRRVSGSTTTTYSEKTSGDWLSAGKPIRVMYDGTQWIADMPVPYAGDFMGTLLINNGGTGATTAAQARINLGIETADGTVSSRNAVYAEVGEWVDGNPNGEDRIGYFVCIDNSTAGTTMKKATANDDIRGVTVAAPAFSGNCSSDKFDSDGNLLAKYSFVAVMGMVSVIDNGTCTVNGRCMPNANSTASPVDGDYGYQVIERIDDTHILIAVEPGTDTQYNFKNYIDDNKESKKLVFGNVAVARSAFVSDTTYSDYGYRAAISLDGVDSSMIPEVIFDADIAASGDFSSVSAAYDGGVYIYSASVPSSELVIPTIVCWSRDSGTEASIPLGGGAVTGNLYMNGYSISGLSDPTDSTQAATKGYVDTAVRKAAPRNLLDNSDFRKPVNQRGKTAYFASDGYGIDRWFLWSVNSAASASVDTDGIALNPLSDPSVILGQRFQKGYLSNDRTYTLAYLDIAGEIHIQHNPVQYGDHFDYIEISSPAWIKLVWAALYEGEYTAETLPEYQPNGYGAELAECQRYYYQTDSYMAFTLGSGKAYTFAFPRMRITPAVTIYNSVSGVSGGVSDFSAGGNYPASIVDLTANTVSIRVDSGVSANTYVCKLIVNADL